MTGISRNSRATHVSLHPKAIQRGRDRCSAQHGHDRAGRRRRSHRLGSLERRHSGSSGKLGLCAAMDDRRLASPARLPCKPALSTASTRASSCVPSPCLQSGSGFRPGPCFDLVPFGVLQGSRPGRSNSARYNAIRRGADYARRSHGKARKGFARREKTTATRQSPNRETPSAGISLDLGKRGRDGRLTTGTGANHGRLEARDRDSSRPSNLSLLHRICNSAGGGAVRGDVYD